MCEGVLSGTRVQSVILDVIYYLVVEQGLGIGGLAHSRLPISMLSAEKDLAWVLKGSLEWVSTNQGF